MIARHDHREVVFNKSGPEKTKGGDDILFVQSPVDPSPEPPKNVEAVSSAEKKNNISRRRSIK